MHNTSLQRVISKCKNHKSWKNEIGKVPAPLLRRPASAPYFQPPFKIFYIPLFSGAGNQNLLPAPLKREEGELCCPTTFIVSCNSWLLILNERLQ